MFGDLFKDLTPDYRLMELSAIWLSAKVNGTRRITAGDHIAISSGLLVSADHATHKIVGCYGDLANTQLEIMVTDVITNEPSILKLK